MHSPLPIPLPPPPTYPCGRYAAISCLNPPTTPSPTDSPPTQSAAIHPPPLSSPLRYLHLPSLPSPPSFSSHVPVYAATSRRSVSTRAVSHPLSTHTVSRYIPLPLPPRLPLPLSLLPLPRTRVRRHLPPFSLHPRRLPPTLHPHRQSVHLVTPHPVQRQPPGSAVHALLPLGLCEVANVRDGDGVAAAGDGAPPQGDGRRPLRRHVQPLGPTRP